MAVFYRTNAQSRALEEAMVRAEVPYKVVGGTKFYDRREVKDVLAYLRVLVNPDDEVSWRRIVNVPKRGVGETSVARLAGWAGSHGLSFGEAVARAERGRGRRARPAGARRAGRLLESCGSGWPCPPWSTRTVTPLPPGATVRSPTARDPRPAPVDPMPAVPATPCAPGSWSSAVVERTGYRSELLAEGTIEALGRVENVDELAGVAASTGRWPSSWRRPRWWPTPTSSTATAPGCR